MSILTGETPLRLPGEPEYTLVLDHEALIAAEALYGQPLAVLIAHVISAFQGAKRALLYGALRTHHPEITPAQAATMVFEHRDLVGAALETASHYAFPPSAEGKDGTRPPRVGKSSPRSGAKRASRGRSSSARPRAASKSKSVPA